MGGNRIGGLKSAKTIGRKSLAERGRKGGLAKVKKGFAVSGKAQEAGRAGGKAKAIKYQDPNFDKELYHMRRKNGLRGQGDKKHPTTYLTPDEHLRRVNPKEYSRQKLGGRDEDIHK